MRKALLIFIAIIIGGFLPQGHQFTPFIRYNLMVLLFFAFLSVQFDWRIFQPTHFKILLVNILLPVTLYLVVYPFHPTYARLAFLLTIIPTAAAGPVIAEIMGAHILTVTGSVLLTTPVIALLLPVLLSYLVGVGGQFSFSELVIPIVTIVFIPLLLSQGIRRFFSNSTVDWLKKGSVINFPLFLLNIIIACGNASHYIQKNYAEVSGELAGIAIVTALLCLINFRVGRWVGTKHYPLAWELAMGRKNTIIGLWIGLTYFNPVIALGPICYIICHNLYNSFQMWQAEKGLSIQQKRKVRGG